MKPCILCLAILCFLTSSAVSQYDYGLQSGFSPPAPSSAPPTNANFPEPKHVLVVFASNIQVSMDIKNAYVAARSIPDINAYGIHIPPDGYGAVLAQNGEEIRGNGNAGWVYYVNNIAAFLENYLSTTYNSEGQLLKDAIRYIVFCKGIPHKVRSLPYYWAHTARKNVSIDALSCLLFQNVLTLYGTDAFSSYLSPLFRVDPNTTLDYRFLPNHFINAREGWKLSYLVSRLDGDDYQDVNAMVQRSLQPDVSGERWRILDDDPCVGLDRHYMPPAYNKLVSLGFTNINPTPFVNTLDWITANPSGQVISYTSYGNNANRVGGCAPGWPRMLKDYILNTLNFQYANGAMFHSWESFNGWTFSHYRLDDEGGRVGQGLIEDFIHRGGTGAEGHTYEPYAYTFGYEDVMHPAYAMGYPLVDAIYQANPLLAWQTVVIGDPLVSIARGKQTLTQNQTWSGPNLVTGKITVPTGKVLTIASGSALKFMPDAELYVQGQLIVNGTQSQPATFNAFKSGTSWKGINIVAGSGSSIQYANINNAVTGIRADQNIGLHVSNCTIDGGNYGVFLYAGKIEGVPNPTTIANNTINHSAVAAIYVDAGASLPVIQNNVLQGQLPSLIGNYGMVFMNSSPLLVIGNKASNFGNAGIYCYNASPSFIEEGTGGHNCSFNNWNGGVGAIQSLSGVRQCGCSSARLQYVCEQPELPDDRAGKVGSPL